MDNITVRARNGFTAVISPDALDDMELLEDLARMDAGEEWLCARVVARLLGAEQKKALYEYCRDPETKRVSVTAVAGVLKDLFAAPELKK